LFCVSIVNISPRQKELLIFDKIIQIPTHKSQFFAVSCFCSIAWAWKRGKNPFVSFEH
jgi:hypothetical protein